MNGPKEFGLMIFIACSFVTWPILGNYTGLGPAWVSAIACGFTALTVLVLCIGKFTAMTPSIISIILLAISGIFNGIACYLYINKITKPGINPAIYVNTVSISMVLAASIISCALLGKFPNKYQVLGIILAMPTIYLLNKI